MVLLQKWLLWQIYGLDYNIFGLTINRSGEDNVGLFGAVDGATINNVTLVGGSITGGQSVGAIVGSARDSVISNSTNSTAVNGDYNIGGIVVMRKIAH